MFPATRPENLERIGRLYGLEPAPAEGARVLELGCADGANLLPMAERLPEARFVGVDIAEPAIAHGRRVAAEAGLANVELRCADLAAAAGSFDYVIAHEVYSWVAPPVREALLGTVKARLAPHGVAFVSHHVKPGWQTMAMAREIVRFAGDAERGRALLEALVAGAHDPVYRGGLAAALKEGIPLADALDGCWFHELAARLAAHGLEYLADAETLAADRDVEPVAARPVGLVEREQYLDLIDGRKHRKTLVCHAGIALDHAPPPARLEEVAERERRARRFATEVPERPVAPALARRGAEVVTNLRHERVALTPAQRRTITLLDGTRERAALPAEVLGELAALALILTPRSP